MFDKLRCWINAKRTKLALALFGKGAKEFYFKYWEGRPSEKMKCPKDLSEWVNSNSKAQWCIYDLNLMPEQIKTREEVCALRGFKIGWEAREKELVKK